MCHILFTVKNISSLFALCFQAFRMALYKLLYEINIWHCTWSFPKHLKFGISTTEWGLSLSSKLASPVVFLDSGRNPICLKVPWLRKGRIFLGCFFSNRKYLCKFRKASLIFSPHLFYWTRFWFNTFLPSLTGFAKHSPAVLPHLFLCAIARAICWGSFLILSIWWWQFPD